MESASNEVQLYIPVNEVSDFPRLNHPDVQEPIARKQTPGWW